jgi:hypothetical protein
MRLLWLAVLLFAVESRAHAQTFTPITDRDFALDLYTGAAIGTARIVGMGGTSAAIAEGSAGTLSNPAAPAVRSATSTDSWDWDVHFDALKSIDSRDFDNNGVDNPERGSYIQTFGGTLVFGDWGTGIVVTTASAQMPSGTSDNVKADLLQAKFAVARAIAREQFTVGVGLRAGQFSLKSGRQELFRLTGAGLEAGGLWRPPGGNLRIGTALSLPVSSNKVEVESCDPLDCQGLILPERVEVPWQVTTGVAWRVGPTGWNQWVGGTFRDERSLTLAADVVLSGSVADAYGLEAFALGMLQRSGNRVAISARAGAEYEVLPGRLRLRGGAYWEPGRFASVGGRPHGTFGLEVSAFEVCIWGRHRLRLSLTGDLAARYRNFAISVGFWG